MTPNKCLRLWWTFLEIHSCQMLNIFNFMQLVIFTIECLPYSDILDVSNDLWNNDPVNSTSWKYHNLIILIHISRFFFVQVCSEIESYLISSQFPKLSDTHLIRCSDLVLQKLKLCRHKGVIEAAGISLSNIVKLLTEKNSCEKWLESIISELINLIEHKTGATVSRKSAGLSLLVQNIVGNDRRPNKVI